MKQFQFAYILNGNGCIIGKNKPPRSLVNLFYKTCFTSIRSSRLSAVGYEIRHRRTRTFGVHRHNCLQALIYRRYTVFGQFTLFIGKSSSFVDFLFITVQSSERRKLRRSVLSGHSRASCRLVVRQVDYIAVFVHAR